jgi:hypothetical protein
MSSTDRILQMVTERNHPTYPLTQERVGLSGMLVEHANDHNTRVTMRAKGGATGYSGEVDLFYTRVGLSALGVVEVIHEERLTIDTLLAAINVIKNAQMTAEDVTNTTMPDTETGVPLTFTLSATDSSLAWLGNTEVTVLNGIPASAPDLNMFLTQQLAHLFPQP